MSDTAVFLAGAWCLLGWLAGVALMLALFWRRICRPPDATVRLLRMQIDDAAVHAARQQAIIDELTAQVAQLYRDGDRRARRFAEVSAERAEAEADRSGRVA